jgi:glucose 1-dehydrogenase
MLLQNKVAIVTGAARGIGQAIAVAMAADGAAVVVNVGGHTPGDETVGLITQAGGRAKSFKADISEPSEVQAMVDFAVKEFGQLDIFVNNAAIETKHPFLEFPIEEFDKIVKIDLRGPWVCSQIAARQMVKQGQGGRIINISSVHEDLPMLTNAPYCAAKGGVRMMTRTIAVELAPHKITVNNIGPGAVYTPIDADVQANPEMEKALMAEIPLSRWGQPKEIADLAVFIASEKGGYMTGSTVFIDGGMLRQAGSL